jgi:ATP-dependent Clp protease ATP-binding subunit ClpC
MFERFSEEARQVVAFAQEGARALRHDYFGTEAILLGLPAPER